MSRAPDDHLYASMELLHRRYDKKREHQLSDSFRMHLAGVKHCTIAPEWDLKGKPQSNHLHHIDIGLTGLREVTHNERISVLRPGDVWLLPGNTPVQFRCLERSEALLFAFSCEWLPGIDPLLNWVDRKPLKAGTCDIAEWLTWLEKRTEMDVAELLCLRSVLTCWLAAAIPKLKQVLAQHVQQKTEFADVLDLVEQRVGADLHIADLARVHGTPPRAFSKQFIQSMGMNPSDYLGLRLNQEALHWVENTELQLKEIAAKLHFNNEFYFSRFFKKYNGVSPMKYRLEMRQLTVRTS